MKKLLAIVFVLSLSLAGCSFLDEQVDYASLCAQDPECLSDAKSKAALASTIVAGFYPPAAGAVGGAALILLLWWGGKKKKESL